MKPTISIISAIALQATTVISAPQAITSSTGVTITAEWIKLDKGTLFLTLENGTSTSVPLSRLDSASQEAVKKWALEDNPSKTDTPALEALLETAGQPLFINSKPLWKEAPKDVAERLGWPRESKTPRQSSFRAYPRSNYRLFGARPFSAALYGVAGAVDSLSLVYTNKGDFFGGKSGEAHFNNDEVTEDAIKKFKEAMENDESALTSALTAALGEPTVQRFGEGKSKRKVSRWDWGEHALLLSAEEGEYVGLLIQPTTLADEGGKAKKVTDAEVRPRIRANVERRENGDVIIQNLPMVDQGPKGYCVPATFERCMRYLDVPADMYLLAMAGQSGLGGGTSVSRLISAVERDVRRKGRKFDILSGNDLRMSRLAKYIDNGIPIIWTLHSTDWFNKKANTHTKARRDVDDWKAWAATTEEARREVKSLDPASGNSHVVIITGYNKETGEIAFSDSWGDQYRERWVVDAEAKHVSQGRLYVIRL